MCNGPRMVSIAANWMSQLTPPLKPVSVQVAPPSLLPKLGSQGTSVRAAEVGVA